MIDVAFWLTQSLLLQFVETKKWVHIFCLILLPPCDIKTFYAVRVLYVWYIFGYIYCLFHV